MGRIIPPTLFCTLLHPQVLHSGKSGGRHRTKKGVFPPTLWHVLKGSSPFQNPYLEREGGH